VLNQHHSDSLGWWEHEKSTWPHHETSRFVNAAGLRWHVQQMGSGPVLLLVHGTGASTHSWRDLLPLLARQFSVIAADLPGHGFTDASSGTGSSIEGMSSSLAALLRTLNVDPRYCVGHSAGAVILCRMALDGHIAPRTIVSINGAFVPLAGVASRLFSPAARLLASNSLVAWLIAQRANRHPRVARLIASTGSLLDEAGIDLYARLARSPRHVAGALRMMGNWDLRGFARMLPRLPVPLVLIAADNDLMVPADQALAVRSQVPHAKVVRLAGLGHLAHEEKPQDLAEKLLAIFAAHSG
jgi:magnesium chelatase accessory protein